MPWHLKNHLFHGICKHIQDSIRYLYSNAEITYSQLMVTTCKAESEMEEAKDKVRARSAVTTEVVDGSKVLDNQIAKLIATLTRAERGHCPTSAPNSPRHRGHRRGWTDRNTPTHPSSHNVWTGLGQTTSACSSSASSRISTIHQGRGNTQGPSGGQGMKDPNSLQCFWCQGWGHMARECATPAKMLNKDWGTKRMWPHPHQQQWTVNSYYSLPDPKPKPTQMKAVKRRGWSEVTPVAFLNPKPIAHLVECSNEVPVIVDGLETTAIGLVVGIGGDRGCSHPILWVCGG